MMFRLGIFLFILLALGACSAPTPTALPPTAVPAATTVPSTPQAKGKIRVNDATPRLVNLPMYMVFDDLRAQGYEVETVNFPRFDLVTVGLADGNLDIAFGSMQTMWAAIGKGSPIETVAPTYSNTFVIAAKSDIKTCADLNGKSFGSSGATSVAGLMIKQYLATQCNHAEVQSVVIPTSDDRIPALIAGQVDAAQLELDLAIELDRQAPGKFHRLVALRDAFPDIPLGGIQVRREFAAQHPEIVKAMVRAMIEATRKIQDKQVLIAMVTKYLAPTNPHTLDAVDTYLKLKMWGDGSELNQATLERTLKFLQEAGSLPQDLTIAQVADLSYLNAVLDEIGRK